jgi:hypothetical protein
MCTKIQDFACKIPKFFRGLYPRTPSAGGGDPLPHPPPAWLRHARRRSAPRLRGPRPPLILQHPPKFKILYNTLKGAQSLKALRQCCLPGVAQTSELLCTSALRVARAESPRIIWLTRQPARFPRCNRAWMDCLVAPASGCGCSSHVPRTCRQLGER